MESVNKKKIEAASMCLTEHESMRLLALYWIGQAITSYVYHMWTLIKS